MTKSPHTGAIENEAYLSLGSFGTTRAGIGSGGSTAVQGLDYRFDLNRSSSNGFINDTRSENWHLSAGLDYRVSGTFKVFGAFEYKRDQAKTAGVDWNVVLQADAADRGSRHWINLQRLVQRTLPALRSALLNSPAPVLLVSAGLLARYDLMGLITELEENAGRPAHTHSVWLLLPTSHQGLPVIDGVAVPMVNNIHNTRALALPQAWIENKHRAKTATAGRATT